MKRAVLVTAITAAVLVAAYALLLMAAADVINRYQPGFPPIGYIPALYIAVVVWFTARLVASAVRA